VRPAGVLPGAGCRVSSVPRDGTLLGSLFESLACLSVRTFAQASGGRTHHLREKDGRREVDFVVEQDAGIIAFEVKLSATVDDRDVRHLLWLRDEVGDDLRDLVILTTGPEAYRRAPVEPERLARLHDFGARLTAGDPELVARIESIDPGEEQNQGNL